MEKVQAAIAKARAARNAETATEAPSSASKKVHRDGPASGSQMQIDRTAVWQPLATFAPVPKLMSRQRIITFDPESHESASLVAFDVLRTKVLQQMRSKGWKRLAITSPRSSCGKTTVTLNLAFSLARQPELHTVVAEMDMRRPSIAKVCGIKGGIDFSSVIAGKADFADAALRPRQNLAFGMNYTRTRNPSELLQSSRIGRVLAGIEERYKPDLTIFDMPPMLDTDDTLAFMAQVDCVLLVVGAESTTIPEIDVCERDLAAQTNVMGVLLNKCRYTESDSTSVGQYY